MTELVNYVAEETGLTKADTKRAMEAFEEYVKKELNESGKVTLTGFITFTKKHKDKSEARNPRTGEKVPVPARNVVTIKAGSKLKEAVN